MSISVETLALAKKYTDSHGGGGGGGGTSNYSDLSNKPKINNVTLSGNQSASDLGLGTYSKPSGGIPDTDLSSGVQASLGKADTALQSHQSLSAYRTSADQDIIDGGKADADLGITGAAIGKLVKVLTVDSSETPTSFGVTDPPSAVVTVLTPLTTIMTLEPCPVTYNFGEQSELTLTVTATSQYHFMFSCPSASATVLSTPGITGYTGADIEAGKTYECDIWAGIRYLKEIEITAVT